MKLSTIRVIKDAFKERENVTITPIQTKKLCDKITAYQDANEVVFIKEGVNGGTVTAFELNEENQQHINQYGIDNQFKQPYELY